MGAFHGAGEGIRGTVNSFFDDLGGDKGAAAKQDAVTQKGVNEMEGGHFNAHDMAPTTDKTRKPTI